MRYVMIGAGAVGAAVGGRLAEAGQEVVLVARGAHYEALRAQGLRLSTPDGVRTHRLPVVQHPDELGELRADDVLFLAVKTQDSEAAVEAWGSCRVVGGGTAAERLPLVCAQNGVESERIALRRFRQVYGMCVWLPATFVEPGVVSAAGAPYTGILHLGRYPQGVDGTAHRIAAGLETAKLRAPVVPDVMRWKYGKLLANLANAVEAVGGQATGSAGAALVQRARAEGEAVLAAAGIAAVGSQEQQEARGDLMRLEPVEGAPQGGSSSWQSLARGTGRIEADYLNGEIVLLGRMHGVRTPVNEALQHAANAFAREQRRPGSMPVSELTALADQMTPQE
ncbi:2-dehydropantoate 2-reductase [Streptomyces sp. YIM 130001]|uniref:ketopantoate reductase family protein n=1 Tax=Streptomyces sp. YIM 130001 TaxID=2259644 RepID=UPI000E65B5C4|nr:2-dehydropantoate 2-reductase N-terminal domain-containing protein [Streptomyces sp. YIM 130001]RII14829.1 2-dehydropantoate 2-reductase [Streptomyces sp. YIM 130001]